MVLGLRAKSRKGPSVHIDYLIHVQEIKPWPPSQSLKSLRSVLLQWENGEKNSGSTSPVVPSLGSGVGDGKIEFGQSFRLPVTLTREFSLKSGDADTFQKNYIEFNLYEPRREMTVKGQHLGTAMIDLAEYGIAREMIIVSAPMNCKRSFRNTPQPLLFLKIQPFDKHSCSSTPKGSLSKESSLNRDGQDSVSALMNGEYAKEAEFASFTDDDTSSHSSLTITSACEASGDSPTKGKENALEAAKSKTELLNDQPELPSEPEPAELGLNEASERQHLTGSSSGGSSSTNLSSGVESPKNVPESSYDSSQSSLPSMVERAVTNNMQSLPSPLIDEFAEKEVICIKSNSMPELEGLTQQEFSAKLTNGSRLTDENIQESLNRKEIRGTSIEVKVENDIINLSNASCSTKNADHQMEVEDHRKLQGHTSNVIEESGNIDGVHAGLIEEKDGFEQQDDKFEGNNENKNDHSTEFEHLNKMSPDAMRKVGAEVGDTALNRSGIWVKSNSLSTDRQRHVKSVRSSLDLLKANGSASCNQLIGERKEIDTLESSCSGSRNFTQNRRKNMSHSGEARTNSFDGKVQQLEHKVERLEGELREAAALELSLYSVVAEHGSSVNKVHAPARRLSRLYLHAWKQWSSARRASAAKSAISGLVLVAKACGNDVPRLSFWLSNSVVLRVIIKSAILDSKPSVFSGLRVESNGSEKKNGKGSLLIWEPSLPSKTEISVGINENNWEDPLTFTTALEKIEAWIFSRIIESVWWQTLTPHMQSASRKVNEQRMRSSLQNSCGKNPILGDQEQANISLELWKIAFKDACERICPVRAAGHECGCLPVLARLVMEQCVSRLDVAMFNAILRESDDEIPTDPVSDPISDLKVLPIPAGRSSFGAGAQLKNAIGNWSRWLSDLFGIDDEECQDGNELSDKNRWDSGTSSKSFPLLNALSDLMMLPKDMLLNRSIRKEVCPTIGVPLIKRILGNFVPDEFCPDPIPVKVFEALDTENILEVEEEYIRHFPCDAAPVVYLPPSAASLVSIPGEVGNGSPSTISASSLLRKSYTSDDELEELDSPLASIMDNWRIAATPDKKMKRDARRVVRYQLLQEVWRDGD